MIMMMVVGGGTLPLYRKHPNRPTSGGGKFMIAGMSVSDVMSASNVTPIRHNKYQEHYSISTAHPPRLEQELTIIK